MRYLEIDIRLELDGPDAYRARVLRSPGGEARASASLPASFWIAADRIRALVEARGPGARDVIHDPPPAPPVTRQPHVLQEYGRHLFDVLIPPDLLGCYRASRTLAQQQQKGLRVRLRVDDARLATVPWEYSFDPKLREYLCLSNETSVVRYLDIERPPNSLTVSPPLQVLGLVASPSDLPALDVEREQALLEQAVEDLTEKGLVKIEWLERATWRDLQAAMRRGPWHALHYIGHSGILDGDAGSVLALCDEQNKMFQLRADDLRLLVSGHNDLRLVVLNSCESGRTVGADLFSSAATELIRSGVPAVVAMQFAITDRAAVEFSRTFYEALAEGVPLDRAVGDARRAIHIVARDTCQWGTPVLHMHALDGALFDVDVRAAVFQPPTASTPPVPSPEPATRPPEPAGPPAAVDGFPKGRTILAQKVRKFWVEGVLEHSVFRAAQIELGMDHVEGAVSSPWTSVLSDTSKTSWPLPANRSIADVFEEEGGSLLILGEPGSGKTTTMLRLLRELLAKFDANTALPAPVVLNLSSWSDGLPLDQWIVEDLSRKYQIPRKFAKTWLAEANLLPLLDGLDEVSDPLRPRCVETINAFLQGSACGTVVCCRLKEYMALPNRLKLNTAIRLRELTREQVLDWVRAAGSSLAGLHDALQRDSELMLDARSPFMLSLMAQAYRDLSAESLAREGSEPARARRARLMEAYVARMFRRAQESPHG